ncbi:MULTISPECIES: NAD-dependent epimerase/dehydratase family protein [Kosakonia]|uniref:NAD-dependent epimerase/dehydratase family protein n=1 Tax=Kosakonia TaxID=1330547 RepID=UPI000B1C0A71|nr:MULTISPECIES: NAD(P)-dependent oxidoreductase [Kosakonia]RCX01737.1 dTDP-6-deoxy-L-talose 4-dehydrogenase (NAD+) [Kosakonia sp. AG348]
MIMKIAVTGAGGYIGKHVVRALALMHHDVSAIVYPGTNNVVLPENGNTISPTLIEMDILEATDEQIIRVFGQFDAVLHLAWNAGFNHHDQSHISNVMRHYSFLKALITAGVKNISVAGTMHEIGYHVGEITENTACNPINPYGIAKNFLRQACIYEMEKACVSLKWLRMFYITGDDRNSNSIFAKIIAAEDAGKETFPLNSGEMLYDFIDIDCLAQQIATATIQTDIHGVINCSSGKPKSLRTAVENFIAQHKLKIKPEYNVYPARPYDSPAIWGDSSKIEKIMANGHSDDKQS